MGQNLWIFVAIPVVMVGLGLLIAFTRRGSVTGTQIGSRCLEVTSAADPKAVFERIRMMGEPYVVDDHDAQSGVVVLSSPPTFSTWGFLYPVVISKAGTGCRIRIGITSKFIQIGPLVTRAHEQVRQAIEGTLGVPAARVARY